MKRWLPFASLEVATVLSGTGNGIAMVAFPWLVLELTGDATAAALVGAVTAIPLLLATLMTGTVVDMLGRQRVSIASDLLSMTSLALVPLLAMTRGLDLPALLAVAVLGAVFDPAGITARYTMLPAAAARAGITLERANGLHESSYALAYLVGPGIGGLLIGVAGAAATFWATAGAFALAALVIAVTPMPGGARPAAHERPHGVWRSTREGLAFLWHDRVLRTLAVVSAMVVGVWLPIEGVVLPVHYTDLDAPAELGLLITAMSGGGVVGALLYAAWGSRLRRRTAFVGALIGTALPVVGLAALPPYPVMLALGAISGVCFGPINPVAHLVMQERTPEALRGRVVGVMGSSAYVAGPIGYLVAGPLVERLGVQAAFALLAVAMAAVAIASALLPSLRGLDDPPPPAATPTPERLPAASAAPRG